jgi:hypothetical protein
MASRWPWSPAAQRATALRVSVANPKRRPVSGWTARARLDVPGYPSTAMDTSYYVAGDVIWGPRKSGTYRIENGRIHGPDTAGEFWIGEDGRIFGPGQTGSFRIENGRIYGPHANLPWLPKSGRLGDGPNQ